MTQPRGPMTKADGTVDLSLQTQWQADHAQLKRLEYAISRGWVAADDPEYATLLKTLADMFDRSYVDLL